MPETVFSVTQLNGYIKLIMSSAPALNNIYLRGEISNFKAHTSGHLYMTIKDQQSSISCVMFKSDAARVRFKIENGMNVLLFGRVSVFERTGGVQFYASGMQPDGMGELQIAFELLKNKLAAEGLFDEKHKRELPRFPKKVGIVTSPTGAAVHDIIRVIKSRYRGCDIYLYPSLVQGESAPKELIRGIEFFNGKIVCDVIIIGRGGGSAEDLWAFNDEGLARAIFSSRVPVISAVGHEVDFTISDFVADARAATPSNAAEIATVDSADLLRRIRRLELSCRSACANIIKLRGSHLKTLTEQRTLKHPKYIIEERRLLTDNLYDRLADSGAEIIRKKRERFVELALKADGLSPVKTLGRGFGLVTTPDKRVITSSQNVKPKDKILIGMSDGELKCSVDEVCVYNSGGQHEKEL